MRRALGLLVLICACDSDEGKAASGAVESTKKDAEDEGALGAFTSYQRRSIGGEAKTMVMRMAAGAQIFVARAVGDLDCDGTLAKFERRGTIKDGAIVLEPIVTENELD